MKRLITTITLLIASQCFSQDQWKFSKMNTYKLDSELEWFEAKSFDCDCIVKLQEDEIGRIFVLVQMAEGLVSQYLVKESHTGKTSTILTTTNTTSQSEMSVVIFTDGKKIEIYNQRMDVKYVYSD